jgi:hypothetical protein
MEHWDAWCNLGGSLLGALGGLYLAYDILGGKNGPLAGVTRVVTYVILFGIAYGLGLGLRFGLVASLGMGIVLGFDFELEARRLRARKNARHWFMHIVIVLSYALALSLGLMSITNGLTFLFIFPIYATFSIVVYLLGWSPAQTRIISKHPVFRTDYLLLSIIRGVVGGLCYWAGITLDSITTGQVSFSITAWRAALTIGGGSLFVGTFTSCVEWWMERLSVRWMAVVGVVFAIFGFLIQAFPNWVILLK